ncbi:hypothetical protein DNTS_011664 [Danionella cerebrum]|uniref:Fibronectin type-III domain-containing protein n=1 Tax=Danionella cerebrum TaxID=2873325 RepID=A0A553P172_9TELE|nr:hypothetical protein DNTS_011664 [Danionella translucida]
MQCCVTLALLLSLSIVPAHGQNALRDLPAPQILALEPDLPEQTLSLTWRSDSALFDIEIFHTEFMTVVLNETVAVNADAGTGQHRWTWRSPLPLECTSHSVHIRARNQLTAGQWSPLQTIPGSDIPENSGSYMFPQDKTVLVGSNMSFCCIVKEKESFSEIHYRGQVINATRLSRRSYAVDVSNQPASSTTGTNVVCSSNTRSGVQELSTGAVVFVGYPPGDEGLLCETRDLATAEPCPEDAGKTLRCVSNVWEDNWTLETRNPLGTVQLKDSASLSDRVHLRAPENVTGVQVEAWRATLQWSWSVEAYKSLDMICQVRLFGGELSSLSNFTGAGLSSVMLERLWPDEDYTVTVRCASMHSFWRWGEESAPFRIHTKMARPDALDVWLWRDGFHTGRVFWKPLSVRESHGALIGFELSQSGGASFTLPPENLSLPITADNSSDIIVTVAARNPAGLSPASAAMAPAYIADSQLPVSELLGTGGSFQLSWQPDASASRGYVVEWVPAGCRGQCRVNWRKLPEANSSFSVEPGSLEDGVRFTVSLYALSDLAPKLLHRWTGFSRELTPIESVRELSANQTDSGVLLSWKPAVMEHQRGFIRGYTIYKANAGHLNLIANISNPDVHSFSVKGLSLSSYKFVVKAYTSAGEDMGATVTIKLQMDSAEMLFVGILVPLASMFCFIILITICCYRKREWVKKAFYPEIPGPKVPGGWSSPQAPLDVKPSPHSLVHIVETPDRDFIKEGLVPVPEEEEEDENLEVDSDSEPGLLRYYNQVIGSSASDSSASSSASVGSTHTDITYAGIQSPSSSSGAGYRPQTDPNDALRAQDEEVNNGYKPQCSWQMDSPEPENLSGSLGSPTSVTSSQFLIPESSEEKPQTASSWFHGFLSGKS